MRTDLYHAETKRIAAQQGALLDEARSRLLASHHLTPLEQNGVLHGLQVLIENAIGKAMQQLKVGDEVVPISAYDVFTALARIGLFSWEKLPEWYGIVSRRNRIAHDYMNADTDQILHLASQVRYALPLDFLMAPLNNETI